MLAHERGDEVHLLAGLAPEWLQAGSTNAVTSLPTRVGSISVSVETSADGSTARLRASAPPRGRAVIHVGAFVAAGFVLPAETGASITLAPGQNLETELSRPLKSRQSSAHP